MTSPSRRPLGQGPTPAAATAPREPRLLPAELAAAMPQAPAVPAGESADDPDDSPQRRQLGTGAG